MRRFFTTLIITLILIVSHSSLWACGYDFHGGCSTNIAFRINGTVDSFYVDNCPFGLAFQDNWLGNLQTLNLHKVTASTWESCFNNVTAVVLHYRVYEVGTMGGAWQQLSLGQDSATLQGPYTTRHHSLNSQLSLTNGLTIGHNYVFEVYFEADIDTIGDDFIPETILLQNNNGSNYRLTFRYGGPTAPPFTVVPNRVRAVHCPGGSDGVAGVSVYGNQNGLFYAWNGFNNNFYALSDVPAGSYIVTVSGASGYAEIDTVIVPGPPAFFINFSNVQAAGCNGQAGQATVQVTGGTTPYTYAWPNGTNASTAALTAGSWTVTVSDTQGCSATATVSVPGQAQVTLPLQAEICAGQSYFFGNQMLSQPGVYTAPLSGSSGCDTLLQLTLSVLSPAPLLVTLPEAITLTCAQPGVSLCLPPQSGASYQWWQGNQLLSSGPCAPANQPGNLTVIASLLGNLALCTAVDSVVINVDAALPVLSLSSGAVFDPQPCLDLPIDSVSIVFTAASSTPGVELVWTLQGQPAGTGASLTVFYPAFEPGLSELPTATALAPNGCSSSAGSPGVEIYSNEIFSLQAGVVAASGPDAPDGELVLWTEGSVGAVQYAWSTGDTGALVTGLLPGTYCVTATDGTGCPRDTCLQVPFTVGTASPLQKPRISLAPNPVMAGATLRLTAASTFSKGAVLLVLDAWGRQLDRVLWPPAMPVFDWPVPAGLPSGPVFLEILPLQSTLGGAVFRLECLRG